MSATARLAAPAFGAAAVIFVAAPNAGAANRAVALTGSSDDRRPESYFSWSRVSPP